MKKEENPERNVFRVCSADSERRCPHILPGSEVLVKGVYFCFTSKTELGTAFRAGETGSDSVIWHFADSAE